MAKPVDAVLIHPLLASQDSDLVGRVMRKVLGATVVALDVPGLAVLPEVDSHLVSTCTAPSMTQPI